MHTCSFIERNAIRYPDDTATEEAGVRQSWRAFRDRITALAGGLAAKGVRAGDRVAILAENSVAYMEVTYATQWLGAVSVPINTRWTPDEVAFALEDSSAQWIFIDQLGAGCYAKMPAEVRKAVGPVALDAAAQAVDGALTLDSLLSAEPVSALRHADDDVASIFYTGGTTGRSKGVQLTHANHVLHSLAFAAELSLTHRMRHLHVAPMFHIADALFFPVGTALGGVHHVIPRFEPSACAKAILDQDIDQTILVPTMIGMMMNEDAGRAGLKKLRRLLYGASPMPQALLDRVMKECPSLELIQAYGQTESSPVLTLLSGDDHRNPTGDITRSAGRAMLGCEVAIFDANDQPLPPGAHGEIVARGPQVTPGYLNRPDENRDTFRGGWLHTGDAGVMDERGYVYVTDRIKDMIVT
ncbi:MAG: AMP-binding protein, partial [Algiphilus sp.]